MLDAAAHLTVVMPLFNKEQSVARAIDSVLNQTAPFQQLIIVNDGSTDRSVSVVHQFDDSRITLINQVNQGVAAARNTGIAAANTQYVCFLDADDQWHPYFLEEIIQLISLNPQAGMFCARYEEIDESSQRFVGNLVDITSDFSGQLPNFFSSYRYNRSLICSSNSCFNLDYFNQIGGYPVGAKIGEDMYVWLNMALLAPVMFSSKISACIYRNAENRSNTREKVVTPYHLQYFLAPTQQALLRANPTLKSFILYNAVIFCLYASEQGDKKTACRVAKRLLTHHIMYGTLCLIGVCMPRYMIQFLRKLRNKKTLSYET